MRTPPKKTEEELREMSREELIEYAMDRQDAAYDSWEASMGRDI